MDPDEVAAAQRRDLEMATAHLGWHATADDAIAAASSRVASIDGFVIYSDAVDVVTVFDRLVDAGLSQRDAEAHLTAGRVEVDGRVVTDPYSAAPRPARIVVVVG